MQQPEQFQPKDLASPGLPCQLIFSPRLLPNRPACSSAHLHHLHPALALHLCSLQRITHVAPPIKTAIPSIVVIIIAACEQQYIIRQKPVWQKLSSRSRKLQGLGRASACCCCLQRHQHMTLPSAGIHACTWAAHHWWQLTATKVGKAIVIVEGSLRPLSSTCPRSAARCCCRCCQAGRHYCIART